MFGGAAAAAVVAALLSATTEMCRTQGNAHEYLPTDEGVANHTHAQCLLCPETAAAPARPDTVYLASPVCDWSSTAGGVVPVGVYTMAAGQVIVSLPRALASSADTAARVTLDGAVRVPAPGCGVFDVALTSALQARAPSVAGLKVFNVRLVGSIDTPVLILNDGKKDTVDATGAHVRNVSNDGGPGQAVVGMVHAVGSDITIDCVPAAAEVDKQMVVIQNFVSAPVATIDSGCRQVNLTALFDVLGSAVTNAMYDVPPPNWVLTLRGFNVRGTGWLIVLILVYFAARDAVTPPKTEKVE